MTVRQLLNNLDSAELAEWYVLEDFDVWKKKVADKEAETPSAELTRQVLFGQQIKKGEAQWR